MSYAETMWSHANVEVPVAHIKPMGDCVLIRVLPEEEVTASGIALPATGKDSSELRVGEVMAVGPGDRIVKCERCREGQDLGGLPCLECRYLIESKKYHPMHVRPGDRIWYRRVLANQQLINGELYQLIHEEAHIWAVLEN